MPTVPEDFRFKQVIAVRTDLEMSKGKIAVQVAHASVTASEEARKRKAEWWHAWLDEGQKKVVVKTKSEEELMELERGARALGLPAALIRDRGLTELPPNTLTSLGIGPCPTELVDRLTGGLPLL